MKFLTYLTILFLPLASLAAGRERISLEDFLAEVREKNLALKVESAKLEAARANARGYNIPPPMVGYMRFSDESGSSAPGFEINQSLPFPSKIIRSHRARSREADAQEQASVARSSEILGQARLLYFNLWASLERRKFLAEKKDVIEGHLRLARAGAGSDNFLRIHLLKAETELDLLENELIAAAQEIREKEAAIAEFLDEDSAGFHPALADPGLPGFATQAHGESPPARAAKLSMESLEARRSEAGSAWIPDIFFRYKSTGRTRLMPGTSEMMIGVSLPFLFPWEPAAAAAKASAERERADLEYQSVTRKVSVARQVLGMRAASIKAQLETIREKPLPRAERRMKVARNLAPRDMETLEDHRQTMEAFPDLKLKVLDLRLRLEEAAAEIAMYESGQK